MDDAERVGRVERLLEAVEALPDAGQCLELVQALLDLYGEGLSRVVDAIGDGPDADRLAAVLTEDELVSHLLMLHGLHPVPLEERVLDALEELRPTLERDGVSAELAGVDDGVVRLRLEGCPSTALRRSIVESVQAAAPEVERVDADAPPAVIRVDGGALLPQAERTVVRSASAAGDAARGVEQERTALS